MQHPYDLTADFVQVVAVDVAAAVSAVLGGAALAADQRAYLDLIGNRNGSYDVGDLLAWLRRTGRPLPTALQRLVGAGGR